MNIARNIHPPICLRYIIWCLTSACLDKYDSFSEIFYYRAKKYVHAEGMKDHGEAMITFAYCQTLTQLSQTLLFHLSQLSLGRQRCKQIEPNIAGKIKVK